MHRILFVESYPHVIFGQQRTMLSLLGACEAMEIEPLVGVTAGGPFVEEVKAAGFRIEFFPYPDALSQYGGVIYQYRALAKVKMAGQLLGYLRRIRARLRDLKLDAVFCNDMRGLLTVGVAARSIGLPVMIWDKLDKPHGWMDCLQLPLVHVNAIISDSVVKKYPKWQRKFYSQKVVRVFNGADLTRFDTACSKREELPIEPDDVVLGIVGTITERKGLDRVLAIFPQACQRVPNLRLFIIGETSGSEEDELYLKSLPSLNHPRVHQLGMRKDVPDLMKSIDILAVPSRHEGMGQVTVEAMAAGKPVVGARAGGIPEVVLHGKTGLIFDGDAPDQLLACIEELSGSAELREKYGRAGRHRVEDSFNRPIQIRKILSLCAGMISNKR